MPRKEQGREYIENLLDSQPEGNMSSNLKPKLPKGYRLGVNRRGGEVVEPRAGKWLTDEDGQQARAWVDKKNARTKGRIIYLKSQIESRQKELEEMEARLVGVRTLGVRREVTDPRSELGYRTIVFKAVRSSPDGNFIEYLTDDGRIVSRFDDNGEPMFD